MRVLIKNVHWRIKGIMLEFKENFCQVSFL